jgi:hypothetical protein
MQHTSEKSEMAETLTPIVTILAKDGKAALCSHLLVSHQCLGDILSGMAYTDLALKYPRSRECLEYCPCTNIWGDQRARSPNQVAEAELEVFDILQPNDPQTRPSEVYLDTYYLDIAFCSYKPCIRSTTCQLLHQAATLTSASWL